MPHALRLGVIGLCLLFVLAYGSFIGLTMDTDVLLHATFFFLRSGDPYHALRDVSPPLILLLYSVPAWLSLQLNIDPAVALHGSTILLAWASLALLHHKLKKHKLPENTRHCWVFASALALLVLPGAFPVFADREHLLYVFALPWIILMVLGFKPGIISTLLAVIGFCIKPYNLILPVVLLMSAGDRSISLRERLFSSSLWALVIGGVLYIVVVYRFFPSYLSEVLPVASVAYPFTQAEFSVKLAVAALYSLPGAGLLLMGFLRKERTALAAWIVASALVFLLNGGWLYTLYLLFVPQLCILFAVAGETRYGKKSVSTAAVVLLALILGKSVVGVAEDAILSYRHDAAYAPLEPAIESELLQERGNSFILLSYWLWASAITPFDPPPQHVFAYNYLSPLPWIMAYPDSPKAEPVRHSLVNALNEAVHTGRASTIIADASPLQRKFPESTDFMAWFQKQPELEGALKPYRLVKTIDHCTPLHQALCRFTIWKALTGPSDAH